MRGAAALWVIRRAAYFTADQATFGHRLRGDTNVLNHVVVVDIYKRPYAVPCDEPSLGFQQRIDPRSPPSTAAAKATGRREGGKHLNRGRWWRCGELNPGLRVPTDFGSNSSLLHYALKIQSSK